MFNLDDLTWICHICKEERPDRFISVYKRPILIPEKGNEVLHFDRLMYNANEHKWYFVVGCENIRFCNDKPACISGASRYSHMEGSESYLASKPTRPLSERVIDAAIRLETLKKSLSESWWAVGISVVLVLSLLLWILKA